MLAAVFVLVGVCNFVVCGLVFVWFCLFLDCLVLFNYNSVVLFCISFLVVCLLFGLVVA